LRLLATNALFEREDVIIVASCILHLWVRLPEAYYGMLVLLEVGQPMGRHELFDRLVQCQYERIDVDFYSGRFRVRGETIESSLPMRQKGLSGWS
jgi:excinuclease ABC subunit B